MDGAGGASYHAFGQKDQHTSIPPPPSYNKEGEQKSGLANSSSWNDSGYAFAPNTNVLDEKSMPSEQAALARAKAAKVMEALKSGEPGAADKAMGDYEGRSAASLTPFGGPKGWTQKIRDHRRKSEDKKREKVVT